MIKPSTVENETKSKMERNAYESYRVSNNNW